MNFFEKQAELQRKLGEVNSSAWQRLMELTSSSTTRYFDLNTEFSKRLPELGDLSGWTDIQREYGEAVWSNIEEYNKTRGEILKEALDESNELVKTAFTPDTDEEPAEAKAA